MLNGAKLRSKIESIKEQAPFVLSSTDRDSFATCRALLVLVALQTYPLLMLRKDDFPPDFVIRSLVESHPKDIITDKDAVCIRAYGDGNPNHINVHIPCRSALTEKPLLPEDVLKRMFHALALWKVPAHGAVRTLLLCCAVRRNLPTSHTLHATRHTPCCRPW